MIQKLKGDKKEVEALRKKIAELATANNASIGWASPSNRLALNLKSDGKGGFLPVSDKFSHILVDEDSVKAAWQDTEKLVMPIFGVTAQGYRFRATDTDLELLKSGDNVTVQPIKQIINGREVTFYVLNAKGVTASVNKEIAA